MAVRVDLLYFFLIAAPIMPTYQGVVNEEGLLALIEYIKSLQNQPQAPNLRPLTGGPAPGEATPAQSELPR